MATVSALEAVEVLNQGQQAIDSLLDQLTDEQVEAAATIGDGDWSAKDLVGHLTAWEEIALDALAEFRAERKPWIEGYFARGAEGIDELNLERVRANREKSWYKVREASTMMHARLVSAVGALSEEEWTAKAPYPAERRQTLGELLGAILGAPKKAFGHAFAHLGDLEAYVAKTRG